jgi:hypothetical protein
MFLFMRNQFIIPKGRKPRLNYSYCTAHEGPRSKPTSVSCRSLVPFPARCTKPSGEEIINGTGIPSSPSPCKLNLVHPFPFPSASIEFFSSWGNQHPGIEMRRWPPRRIRSTSSGTRSRTRWASSPRPVAWSLCFLRCFNRFTTFGVN